MSLNVKVTAIANPITREVLSAEIKPGRISDVLGPLEQVNYFVNGEPVGSDYVTAPGDDLQIVGVPSGDRGKDFARVSLQIAVIAAATALTGGIGSTFLAVGARAAITYAGFLGVNALIPVREPGGSEVDTESFTRLGSLTGVRNALNQYGAVPRVLGKHRIFPPISARPFTEIVGNRQYLRVMFNAGAGPLRLSDPKIGDTVIGSFDSDNVFTSNNTFRDIEVDVAENPDLYSSTVNETVPGVTFEELGNSAIRQTGPGAEEISVDFTFPRGLFAIRESGRTTIRRVTIQVQYRETGTTSWIGVQPGPGGTEGIQSENLTYVSGSGAQWDAGYSYKRETYRGSLRWKVPPGEYDVRVTRLIAGSGTVQPDDPIAEPFDTFNWSALRWIINEYPNNLPGTVQIALRVRATDQVSGVLDRFSVVAESMLPEHDGMDWIFPTFDPQTGTGSGGSYTSNPANAMIELLAGSMNSRPLAMDRIDTDSFLQWRSNCAAEEREINIVLDANRTVLDLARMIGEVGRGSLSIRDAKYTIVEDLEELPVQHFTPRNSWDFEGSRVFPRIPHALKVRFRNEDRDYREDEIIVYDDGYSFDGTDCLFDDGTGVCKIATVFEKLDFEGVTNYKQAWKEGRFRLAEMRLRPERYSLMVDVENIIAQRGDTVRVSHDVTLWGLASGRVKNVLRDGSDVVESLVLDEAVQMEAGQGYNIRIRNRENESVVLDVVTNPGEHFEIDISSSYAGVLNAGDLFMFGETDTETQELKVLSVEPMDDLTARLNLIDAAPDIYGADQGTIPPFNSNITDPIDITQIQPSEPIIERVRTAYDVLYPDADRSLQSRIVVDFRVPPGVPTAEIEGRFRAVGIDTEDPVEEESDEWTGFGRVAASTGTISLRDVEQGGFYRVQIRAVNGELFSDWVEYPDLIEMDGQTNAPKAVEGLSAEIDKTVIRLTWKNPAEEDIYEFEIRRGSDFVSSDLVGFSLTTNITDKITTSGNVTYWVRAINTARVRGATASVTINIPDKYTGEPIFEGFFEVDPPLFFDGAGRLNLGIETNNLKIENNLLDTIQDIDEDASVLFGEISSKADISALGSVSAVSDIVAGGDLIGDRVLLDDWLLADSADNSLRANKLRINNLPTTPTRVYTVEVDGDNFAILSNTATGNSLEIAPDGTVYVLPDLSVGGDAFFGSEVTIGGKVTLNDDLETSGAVASSSYSVSGGTISGWRGLASGDWEIASLRSNELTVEAFTAEVTQLFRGRLSLTKSFATLAENFTVEIYPSGMVVHDIDASGANTVAVGDFVEGIVIDLSSGLAYGRVWFRVNGVSQNTPSAGLQTWSLVAENIPSSLEFKTIFSGSEVRVYGSEASPVGVIEDSVFSASPYRKIWTWTTNPFTPANRTTVYQHGNLDELGIAGVSGIGVYTRRFYGTESIRIGSLTGTENFLAFDGSKMDIRAEDFKLVANGLTIDSDEGVEIGVHEIKNDSTFTFSGGILSGDASSLVLAGWNASGNVLESIDVNNAGIRLDSDSRSLLMLSNGEYKSLEITDGDTLPGSVTEKWSDTLPDEGISNIENFELAPVTVDDVGNALQVDFTVDPDEDAGGPGDRFNIIVSFELLNPAGDVVAASSRFEMTDGDPDFEVALGISLAAEGTYRIRVVGQIISFDLSPGPFFHLRNIKFAQFRTRTVVNENGIFMRVGDKVVLPFGGSGAAGGGGGSGFVTWNSVIDKPFEGIGSSLRVENENLKIRNVSAMSVMGRVSSSGDPEDIVASSPSQVLRRSGSSIGFGAIDLSSSDAVSGVLSTGNIPDLDAGKITSGTLSVNRIPDLDAGKITTGVFSLDRIPTITNAKLQNSTISGRSLGSDLLSLSAGSGLEFSLGTAYNGGTSRTIRLQTTIASDRTFSGNITMSQNLNVSGNVTGANLNISDWNEAFSWGDHAAAGYAVAGTELDQVRLNADLDDRYLQGNETITLSGDVTGSGATSISTTVTQGAVTQHEGAINHNNLSNYAVNQHRVWENSIVQNVHLDNIPNLPASRVTSGTFSVDRIPDLAAGKITSGTFDLARIPDLPASKTTTGTFDLDRIPTIPNSKLENSTISGRALGTDLLALSAGDGLEFTSGTTFTGAIDRTIRIGSGSVTNAMLDNSSLSVNTGAGMSGGGSISLGGSRSLSIDTSWSATFASLTTSGDVTVGNIAANFSEERFEVRTGVGDPLIVVGFLGGLQVYDEDGDPVGTETYSSNQRGIWIEPGTDIVISGEYRQTGGSWFVEEDASLRIQTAEGLDIIRVGSEGGDRGLFLYDSTENVSVSLTHSGLFADEKFRIETGSDFWDGDAGTFRFGGTTGIRNDDATYPGKIVLGTNTVILGDLEGAGGTFSGDLSAAGGTFAGNLSAAGGTFEGTLSAVDGTFTGELSAATGTFAGTLSAVDGTFSGTLSAVDGTFAGELTAATGTFAGELSAASGTFTGRITAGDIAIGNDILPNLASGFKGITFDDSETMNPGNIPNVWTVFDDGTVWFNVGRTSAGNGIEFQSGAGGAGGTIKIGTNAEFEGNLTGSFMTLDGVLSLSSSGIILSHSGDDTLRVSEGSLDISDAGVERVLINKTAITFRDADDATNFIVTSEDINTNVATIDFVGKLKIDEEGIRTTVSGESFGIYNTEPADLVLQITNGFANNKTIQLLGGFVGIGTQSADRALDIVTSNNNGIRVGTVSGPVRNEIVPGTTFGNVYEENYRPGGNTENIRAQMRVSGAGSFIFSNRSGSETGLTTMFTLLSDGDVDKPGSVDFHESRVFNLGDTTVEGLATFNDNLAVSGSNEIRMGSGNFASNYPLQINKTSNENIVDAVHIANSATGAGTGNRIVFRSSTNTGWESTAIESERYSSALTRLNFRASSGSGNLEAPELQVYHNRVESGGVRVHRWRGTLEGFQSHPSLPTSGNREGDMIATTFQSAGADKRVYVWVTGGDGAEWVRLA